MQTQYRETRHSFEAILRARPDEEILLLRLSPTTGGWVGQSFVPQAVSLGLDVLEVFEVEDREQELVAVAVRQSRFEAEQKEPRQEQQQQHHQSEEEEASSFADHHSPSKFAKGKATFEAVDLPIQAAKIEEPCRTGCC